MAVRPSEDYRCKDCEFFNEENVPADCEKGNGKVAFMHRICRLFSLRKDLSQEIDVSH